MNRGLLIGGLAGMLLSLVPWWTAFRNLDNLDLARTLAARESARRGPADRLADAPWRLAAGSAGAAQASVARRVRAAAKANGVLVETLKAAEPIGPGIARIELSMSGPEKAVLTLGDAVERGGRGVRWENWELAAVPGGVRLMGTVAIAWR